MNRQFTFLLSTDPNDLYLVEDCEPPLPAEQLEKLLTNLNQVDDLGGFIRDIRRLWVNTLADDDSAVAQEED